MQSANLWRRAVLVLLPPSRRRSGTLRLTSHHRCCCKLLCRTQGRALQPTGHDRCRHDRLSERPGGCTFSHIYFAGGSFRLPVRQLRNCGEETPLLHADAVRKRPASKNQQTGAKKLDRSKHPERSTRREFTKIAGVTAIRRGHSTDRQATKMAKLVPDWK
jgi:hypothetical protein